MSTTRAMVWQAWSLSSGQALGPARSVPFDQPGGPLDVSLYYRFDDANLNHDGTLLAIGGGPRGHVLVMRTTDGTIVGDLSVDPPAGGWEWPRSENTASVLFAQDDRLLVGGPTGTVLVTEPLAAERENIPVAVERRISAAPQSVERRMVVVDTATGPALLTAGNSRLARLDLASGATVWSTRVRSGGPTFPESPPIDGPNPCSDIAVATRPAAVFCANFTGSIVAVDLATGALRPGTYDRQLGLMGSIAVTGDGRRLVAASITDDTLAVWDLDGSGPVQDIVATDTGAVEVVEYDPSGNWVISRSPEDPDPLVLHNTTDGSHVTIAPPLYFLGWSDQAGRYWVYDARSERARPVDAASGSMGEGAPMPMGNGPVLGAFRRQGPPSRLLTSGRTSSSCSTHRPASSRRR